MVPIHSENQVPGKISAAERRRRQVIQQHKIGRSANAQFAHAREIATERAENGIDDVGIMLKSHLKHQVSGHDSWVTKSQLMQQEGALHLLHHVHTEAIVSQANIDARSYHLFNRRATDGVVHVRARVMHAIGMGFSQPTHLTAVYMHTVCSDAARPQNMICLQAIRYTHSIACHAIVLVRDMLSNVDMEAYS